MTRVEEEAKMQRLNNLRRKSVLPMELDDGSSLYASAVSGGADYVDGMPRQVRLVARDAEGNEVEHQYLQRAELERAATALEWASREARGRLPNWWHAQVKEVRAALRNAK